MLTPVTEDGVAADLTRLRRLGHAGLHADMSYWWTAGGAGFPALALTSRGLPDPYLFAGFLTGSSMPSPLDPGSTAQVLPVDLLHINFGSISHPGKVRSENEDRYLVAPEIGVFAVADGMGGHEDGALASTAVIDALARSGAAVSAADLMARLEDRILRANAELRAAGRARGGVVGTTVAVLLIFGATTPAFGPATVASTACAMGQLSSLPVIIRRAATFSNVASSVRRR